MHRSAPVPAVLTADCPLWEWAYEAVVQRVEAMLEHVGGVREGADIEAVHDMRVASRRLAAAMRVFRAAFPERRYERLMRQARKVTRDLGAVRDLDVLIAHFARIRPGAEGESTAGIDYFLALRHAEREEARRPMLRSLERMEEDDFAGRLRRYLLEAAEAYFVGLDPLSLDRGGFGSAEGRVPDPRAPFRAAAPGLLSERYQAFYAFAPCVEHPEAAAELHEMRIAAKWLRYTMELFAPAYAAALKREIDAVKWFQELLGDLHDADVRIALLEEMMAARLDPAGMEGAGLMRPEAVRAGLESMLDQERGERAGCYRKFAREWRKREKAGFAAACLRRIREPDAPAEEGLG